MSYYEYWECEACGAYQKKLRHIDIQECRFCEGTVIRINETLAEGRKQRKNGKVKTMAKRNAHMHGSNN